MFAILVPPAKLDRSRNERGECKPHTVTAQFEMSPCSLQKLEYKLVNAANSK